MQKVLAAFVLLLFLVLGGFTVGLAQGTPALGVFVAAGLNHELAGGVVQLHDSTAPVGLASETGGLPSTYKYQGPRQEEHVSRARLEVDDRSSERAQIPSRKVSLGILQSVFLL